VLVPGGVVAAWTYGPPEIDDPKIAALIQGFIDDPLGPWWPPEVAHVLDGYVSLDFPFSKLDPPALEMTADWTIRRLLGFVRSWSGVARYMEAMKSDPVEELAADLEPLWGPVDKQRPVRWRIRVRAGRA